MLMSHDGIPYKKTIALVQNHVRNDRVVPWSVVWHARHMHIARAFRRLHLPCAFWRVRHRTRMSGSRGTQMVIYDPMWLGLDHSAPWSGALHKRSNAATPETVNEGKKGSGKNVWTPNLCTEKTIRAHTTKYPQKNTRRNVYAERNAPALAHARNHVHPKERADAHTNAPGPHTHTQSHKHTAQPQALVQHSRERHSAPCRSSSSFRAFQWIS